MPENPRRTLQRYVELLQILPHHGPGKTYRELTRELQERGYSITKRSVERSMEVLRDVFPLECNRKAQPHGWRWAPGAVTAFQGLSLPEALSLTLVADDLARLLPATQLEILKPKFRQARKLIEQEAGRNRAARWSKRVRCVARHLELVPPAVDSEVLKGVQDALLREEQLSIDYQSLWDKAPRIRTVDPHGILQREGVTYLIAQPLDEDTLKQYALHRMKSATPTGRRSRTRGFDFDAYLGEQAHEIGSGKILSLKARVSKTLARVLHQTPLSVSMTLREDVDGAVIEAELRDTLALQRWILGHGCNIEILAPLDLRRRIAEHAATLYRAYGS